MLYDINQLSYAYSEKQVLNGVSTQFRSGGFYGIIGPNGSGKTTLIDLLSRNKKPDTGTIMYHGKNLSSYSKRELAREISLVPQDFNINLPFSTRDVVMMGRYPHIPRFHGPSDKDLEKVAEIMEQTGIGPFQHRPVTELSGGERQRVVFARALVQDTPVLILDEATSNLDVNHAMAMLNLAARTVKKKGRTVIAVFQDINLAAHFCEYFLLIRDGQFFAMGRTEDVLTREYIRAVFEIDAKVYFDSFSGSRQVVFKSREERM